MAAGTRLRAEEILTKTLPNGLLWIHRPVTHNQIMSFYLFFPNMGQGELSHEAGLTSLMTSVMFKGTTRRTARQIAEETEALGVSLDAGCEEDYWAMSGQSTSDRFEQMFDIFQDVLLHPTFPAQEFEKEKQAHLNAIRSKKERIFNVAIDLFQKEIFGRHPYGRPTEGTETTVSSFTRDQLVLWHQGAINPKSAVLVTVGPLVSKKLEKIVVGALGGWQKRDADNVTATKSSEMLVYPAKAKTVEEKHPFEQSYLMMGYPAPNVLDKDYPAVKVLNAMLGGGMSSPLFDVVREQRGLAYEVSSFYPTRGLGSAFVIYAGTDPKNLKLAHDKIREMLADFVKRPPSPQEVEDAKRYIRGHFMMDHQTNRSLARYLGWWQILGLGHAYDQAYVDNVRAVTPDDVRRVAEKIFSQPVTVVKIISNKK